MVHGSDVAGANPLTWCSEWTILGSDIWRDRRYRLCLLLRKSFRMRYRIRTIKVLDNLDQLAGCLYAHMAGNIDIAIRERVKLKEYERDPWTETRSLDMENFETLEV